MAENINVNYTPNISINSQYGKNYPQQKAGYKTLPLPADSVELSSQKANSSKTDRWAAVSKGVVAFKSLITGKTNTNKAILNDFAYTDKYDTVFKKMIPSQYGKNGIPLKYTRDEFLKDLNNVLNTLPAEKRAETEHKFNISLRQTEFNSVGIELEKVPVLPEKTDSLTEQKVADIIRRFTQENEVLTGNKDEKEVLDAIIQEIPEFTSVVGKKQHQTHNFSVDIHTLRNLRDNLQNDRVKLLDDDSKTVLKYSTLLHDLGKSFIADDRPDHGHSERSVEIAQRVLPRLDLKPEVKDRILKQIANHHWFSDFNRGRTTANHVVNLFGNKQDLTIAEIMSYSDLKNVNDIFHYKCMNLPETATTGAYKAAIDDKFAHLDRVADYLKL